MKYEELSGILRDIYNIQLRDIRLQDELRIMQRRDINLDALRHRMVNGRSPKKTMLQIVASEHWNKKQANG